MRRQILIGLAVMGLVVGAGSTMTAMPAAAGGPSISASLDVSGQLHVSGRDFGPGDTVQVLISDSASPTRESTVATLNASRSGKAMGTFSWQGLTNACILGDMVVQVADLGASSAPPMLSNHIDVGQIPC